MTNLYYHVDELCMHLIDAAESEEEGFDIEITQAHLRHALTHVAHAVERQPMEDNALLSVLLRIHAELDSWRQKDVTSYQGESFYRSMVGLWNELTDFRKVIPF